MLVGKGCDLRQMSDAEDLVPCRERLQLLADRFGGAATDTCIDLVEDQGSQFALLLLLFSLARSVAGLDGGFEREHDARHLAPRRDVLDSLERLARIRRDQISDFVEAG